MSRDRAISASSRIVVCSRDLISAVANVEWWNGIWGVSVFIGVGDRVSVEVFDPRQVYCDILIKDLSEGNELWFSTIRSKARHARQVLFKRVF